MYKRRRKVTPAASSTLISDNISNGGRLSSQSSLVSTISAENRSDSPEDMFCDSPEMSVDPGPSTSKENPDIDTDVRGTQGKPKNTTAEVLAMLVTSSDDSEPLSKISKTTNGVEPEKHVFSQPIVGSLKSFSEMLSTAGLVIGKNGEPNMLRKSQFIFVRNLNRIFDKYQADSSRINRFIENLEEYLSDKESLKAALSPTKNHPDANLPGDCLESLVQLLLAFESVQTSLISFLLDKVAEYSVEEDESMVRMILHSMRYLTKVLQPEAFTLKLFDLIHSVSSSMLKHEIISCLPDIISDSQREQTANELMEVLKSEPQLSPSVLFTLSNLWLEPESLYVLQVQLIRSLRKATLDQLPAFLRFLTSGDLHLHPNEVIDGLRSELVICHADTDHTQAKQSSPEELASIIFLIFEKLRDSVLKSKKLGDMWLKNIESVKTGNKHKPIDLLMLLILHSLASEGTRKKSVESVFKSKIKIGHFKESLIQDTLSVGLVVMKEHFSGLLKLLSALLLSPDLTVSNFGASFYM